MELLAIIPARGGSKGVKNKNIRIFNGLPLLAHTIKELKKVNDIGRVIVSTEDKKIKTIAEKYGAEVPFMRPIELARAKSEVVDAMIDLIKKLRIKEGYYPDYVMLLQVTSPLRAAEDIKKAINLYFDKKADSLVSVCRTENLLFTKGKNDVLHILNPEFLISSNRQQLPDVYKLDGPMLTLTRTDLLFKNRSDMSGKLIGFEVERWKAVDIDEPEDFVIGELLHKNYKTIKNKIKKFKQ